MKQRVATDERPFKTGSTDVSSRSEDEPEAALVVPPDGGWGWVVVFASFMCNFIVDGVMLSGGALSPAIREEFGASESQVAPINSLLAGFYLLGGPFVSALANKYGFRVVTICGTLISSFGFAISYYATSVEYLYLTYGVIGGIGFCMIFMPAVLTVGFYFEKWRALATGIALCGSGLGVFIMSPFLMSLVEIVGWRMTILCQSGMLLLCIIFGSLFRPLKPVQVVVVQDETIDPLDKHDNMIKLRSKIDLSIPMPHDMKFSTKASPHTWMGVSSNQSYPTAEEVFRRSSNVINSQRRASATAGTIKSSLGAKPAYATVTEKDEQDDSSANADKATQPLIRSSVIRVISHHDQTDPTAQRRRSSTADLVARPLYREDIFFGASLNRLPQYKSRTSIGYHMAVTHIPPPEEEREKKGRCSCCPVAIRRALATLLDVSLFRSLVFNVLAASGFFTMLGFFVPYMYVTNRAIANNMSDEAVGWLVSTIGMANIVGRIGAGMISVLPKVSPLWVINIALTGGGIATMLSSLSYNNYFQYGYCVIFGLSVACFASLRSIVIVQYLGLERLTNCFGLFLLFQGVGALLSAPVAGALFDYTQSYDISFYVAGAVLLLSGLLGFPIDRISKWEKQKANKALSAEPEV